MATGTRIGLARARRGMSAAELARRLGVRVGSVAGYEDGRTRPDAETVHRLAEVLGFPPEYFTADPLDELPEHAVAFRARSKLSARKRGSAVAAGRLAVEFNEWLEGRFVLPEPDLPTGGLGDPETAAELLRDRWSLADAGTPSMVNLLEAHGVRVFSLPADCTEVDAFSFWWGGTPFVLLNTRKAAEHSRFDAAHELGHLVLHAGAATLAGPAVEEQADAFAAAFLMPKADVLVRLGPASGIEELLEHRARWRISGSVLARRLRALGLVTEPRYRALAAELDAHGPSGGAESGTTSRESSQLLAKVFAALRERGFSHAQIAAELPLSAEELSGLVFGLVIAAVPGRGVPPQPRAGDASLAEARSHLSVVR